MDEEITSLADKVTAILRQRKIVEFSDLVKETGANERDLKLIINLLEKEEMVDVGYSLTKMLISWNDEADRILMKMKKNQKIISLTPDAALELSKNKNGGSKLNKHSVEENKKTEEDLSQFNILKEKSSEELEKEIKAVQSSLYARQQKSKKEDKEGDAKRESSYQIGSMAVKDMETDEVDKEQDEENESFTILNSKPENILKKKIKADHQDRVVKESRPKVKKKSDSLEKEIDKEVKDIERTILLRISGESDNGESAIISLKDSDIVKSAKKADSNNTQSRQKLLNKYKVGRRTEDIDQSEEESDRETMRMLEEKLNQIVNKKAEIADLNKEKTILFDTAHPELKSKLSAQIDALESMMAEKEGRIKELKDKIQLLPEDLNEMQKLLSFVREKEEMINSHFNSSLLRINEMKAKLNEARSDYTEEFEAIRNQIIEQEKELVKISNVHSSLKYKEERILNSIHFAKDNIAKSQEELVNLESQLDNLKSLSKSIELKIEETNKALRSLNKHFESYIEKMRALDNIDNEIREIQSEFLKSKQKIDSKIQDYRNEILSLTKSIELEASQRYLEELERMTSNAEDSFTSLLSHEREINRSIEEKKRELSQLLQEAKLLQQSLSSKYSEQHAPLPALSIKENGDNLKAGFSNDINDEYYTIDLSRDKDVEVKSLDATYINYPAQSNSGKIKDFLNKFKDAFKKAIDKKTGKK